MCLKLGQATLGKPVEAEQAKPVLALLDEASKTRSQKGGTLSLYALARSSN